MELKEYIKQSYLRPNKQVLESLGASDELIEYLRTTPWNTNLNIVDSLQKDDENVFLSLTISGGTSGDEDEGIYSSIWTDTVDNSIIEKINSLTSGNNITVLINDNEWFTTTIQTLNDIITFGKTQNVIISGWAATNQYKLPEYFSINGTIKIILNN